MALIGEMQYLTIGGSTYSIPTGTTVEVERNLTSGTKSATIKVDGTSYDLYAPTPNAGTVTSVRVQATSPVQSSTSTAQSSSLNTTISLANGYGDTKNPYGTKTKNYVLAGPTTGNDAAPTFRALVAADIPDLSGIYLTSYTETDPTVPSWAKADSKPSYTASEVGALPITGGTITTNGLSVYGSLPSATQGAHVAIGNGTIRITGQTSSSYPSVTLAVNNGGLYISSNGNAVKIQNLATPTSNTDAATKKYVDDSVNAISIPTKTSDLTNDSGFLTSYTETDPVFSASAAAGITATDISNWNAKADSDVNVKNTAVTAATTYYLTGSTSSSTVTGGLSKHAAIKAYVTANSGTGGSARIDLGNTTATTSAGGKEGIIRLYGTSATYYIDIKAGAPSANRTITLPNKTGTVALTSDIPTVPTITLNGTSTTTPSFYAPTTAGTNGYFLKSNGSGAPTWAEIETTAAQIVRW